MRVTNEDKNEWKIQRIRQIRRDNKGFTERYRDERILGNKMLEDNTPDEII